MTDGKGMHKLAPWSRATRPSCTYLQPCTAPRCITAMSPAAAAVRACCSRPRLAPLALPALPVRAHCLRWLPGQHLLSHLR